MTNDRLKQAARRRMAETGENYTTARRKVMAEWARLKALREAEITPGRAVIDQDGPDVPAG